ncbi:MAG: polyprenyl synthetase family protein [Phycisphaerae bacterium]
MSPSGVAHRASPRLAELYAPIRSDLAVAARVFDEEVFSELSFVNGLCETVRSYRGKMLRPALLLLCGRATGCVTAAHHTLAAVVEMVHMATLAHDDVLDDASTRRRNVTVNALAGNTSAVLLGDYLISHAFHLCSSLDSQYASRLIGATTNTVCEGELLQNHSRGRFDLSESAYFDIIGRKTAALTATCCALGGRYADGDADVVDALASYGRSVGIAFQIVDDVLDVVGDGGEVGKTLGRDMDLGKLTLPTIHCLRAGDDAVKTRLLQALSDPAVRRNGALRAWLTETGSLSYARCTAERYVADAVARLDVLAPSDAKASLTAMAEFIVLRRY